MSNCGALETQWTTQENWYACQTSARHEKRVAEHLRGRKVECLLPLYEDVHRWKTGPATVHLPLFPGYVFVRLALRDRLLVLTVPGIASMVGFGGQPCPIPDEEISPLLACSREGVQLQPHPYLRVGQRLRVRCGPLAGTEGILLRHKSQYRLVLAVNLIQRSVSLEVGWPDVAPLSA